MRRFRNIFFLLLFVCAAWFVVTFIGLRNDPRNVAPATATSYNLSIERGSLTVPSQAYMDGFDPASNDTISPINIWQGAGAGQRVACTLEDGVEVTVDGVSEIDERTWLHVSASECDGWVLSEFVNPSP